MATTAGFVHQAWLLAGPAACFWVGEDVASSTLLTVAVAAGDPPGDIALKRAVIGTLVDAAAGGQRVVVAHPDDSAAVSTVTYPLEDVTATPVQLDGLEVTQAVQDVSQAVPLIAGKGTVVRAYLSSYGAPGPTVSGQISLRKHPSDPPVVVASTGSVVLAPADAGNLAATRNDAARSLNFVVPATMTAEGPLSVTLSAVTNTLTGDPVIVGAQRRSWVYFHRSAPLRVRVYGARYTQGGVTHVPSDLDFELLLSWLARAYPAGQVVSTRVLITANATPGADPPFSCGDINAQLTAIRALDLDAGDDQRTHYYGLVSDGGFFMRGCAGVPVNAPNPGAIGSGPTGPGTWGWDFDGSYGDWYGGHELGHTFGRLHPGFCGESANDLDNYPYAAGRIGGDDISFMGFDVGDPALGLPMRALPGTQWTDVMTYCAFQWLSAYTYQGIRRRLEDEDNLGSSVARVAARPSFALAAGAVAANRPGASGSGRPDERFPQVRAAEGPAETAPERFASIIATINLTRQRGRIRYVNPVAGPAPTARAQTASDGPTVMLRVTSPDGTVLDEHRVPVLLQSDEDPGADVRGLVDAVVPVPTNAAAVELVVADQLADTFRAATQPPEIRALRTVPAAPDALGFRVEAPAKPSPGQSYFVQVSTGPDTPWTTVAVGLTEHGFTLDRSQFAPGQRIHVRVVATNGFTRTITADQTVLVPGDGRSDTP